jgi:diguanylate cyclase
MENNDYEALILNRIEIYLNRIMPLGAFVAWFSSIVILFSPIHNQFALLDFSAGVVLIVLYLARHKIKIEIRIFLIILIPILIGAFSFTDGGFSSAAMTLFLLSNVVAVFFLSHTKSIIVSSLTFITLLGLWLWSASNDIRLSPSSEPSIWVIQILMFLLVVILIYFIVYAIKRYLFETIHHLETSSAEIFHMAYYDQLTQLPNYPMFCIELKKMVDQHHLDGYFIILSLKNLNMINALYGSDFGNHLLLEAAKALEHSVKPHELIARSGGNEFLFFTTLKGYQDLNHRLESLQSSFFEHFQLTEMKDKLEYYVCFATFNSQSGSISKSYDNASIALTYAKFNQSDSIHSYNKAFEDKLKRLSTLRELIKIALLHPQIDFYYQPKVSTIDEHIVGVEALVRWRTKEYGIIPPDELLHLVSALNLDVDFGKYTINKVLADSGSLFAKYDQDLQIAINISPKYLVSPNFVTDIKESLQRFAINPNQLILEITEEVMIEGVDLIDQLLTSLTDLGINISLDDFGSGYSSLHYLAILDVNELKIDKALIDQIGINQKINILLKSIIDLAHEYNIFVVAEGIETEVQKNALKEMGCQLLQGYYYYKPEPL